jgi:uncharacterized phage protein (TIGR02220 family)
MGIIRVKKETNYVVMNKTALQDNRLSWKAKGIMAYLLSMPDDWTFYTEELVKHSTDGEASFRSGFKELKKYGYVKRYPVRINKQISHWETVVLENPLLGDFQQVENQQVGNQEVENLDVENQRLLNNDPLLSNDSLLSNKDIIPYIEIVDYLNQKANTNYKVSSKKTRELIKARWNDGYDVSEFKKVIDIKTTEWLKDPKMSNYLRPETLFGTKFESYLNQKGVSHSGSTQSSSGQPYSSEYDGLSI